MTNSDGLPFKGVIQTAYIVADIHKAMAEYSSRLHIGPWFLRDRVVCSEMSYRGAPTDFGLSVAMTYSGTMNIELLQQLDEKPSVYREVIERRGYGFHHWAVGSYTFDRDVEKYRAQGYEAAFTATIGPRRLTYFDTNADLGGMIELIEIEPEFEKQFNGMYRACQSWDGVNFVLPRP